MSIIMGALAGGGEALEKVGLKAQDQLGQEKLLNLKLQADRELQASMQEFHRGENELNRNLTREGHAITREEGRETRSLSERLANLTDTRIKEEGKATRDLQGKQLEESSRHNKAMEGIAAANAKRAQTLLDEQIKGMGLERTVKELQIEQAKETKKYRDLATSETDPAKRAAAREAYQLLTGKDNDNFVVNLDKVKAPDGTEEVKGVIKTDKRTGKVTYESTESMKGGTKVSEQWDNKSGDVFVDGKKIGTAKTKDEAIAIVKAARGGAAAPAKPAPATPARPKGIVAKGLSEVLDEQRPYKRPEQEEYVPQSPEG
jgi:hypothetical protein